MISFGHLQTATSNGPQGFSTLESPRMAEFSADETTRGRGQSSRDEKEVTRKRPRGDKARSFISTVLLGRESKSGGKELA
mmetsp:Transcript_17573/g.71106  ORF Transcript_17573/g.71106 Transcript_17573/m.71106 type:complete len:80 (+) Transcript_17573:467-706(+)